MDLSQGILDDLFLRVEHWARLGKFLSQDIAELLKVVVKSGIFELGGLENHQDINQGGVLHVLDVLSR